MTSLPVLVCPRCWTDLADPDAGVCASEQEGCGAVRPTDGWWSLPVAFRGIYRLEHRKSRSAGTAVFRGLDTRDDALVEIEVLRRDGARIAVRKRLDALAVEQAGLFELAETEDGRPGESHFPQFRGMEHADPPYLVRGGVSLPTLRELVAGRSMDATEVARLGVGIALALDVVEAAGMVHTNLTPDCVHVREEGWHVVIAGFNQWTSAGEAGEGATAAATGALDVRAAASLLWFALTGGVPAEGVPACPREVPAGLYDALVPAFAPESTLTASEFRVGLEGFCARHMRQAKVATLVERAGALQGAAAPLAALARDLVQLDTGVRELIAGAATLESSAFIDAFTDVEGRIATLERALSAWASGPSAVAARAAEEAAPVQAQPVQAAPVQAAPVQAEPGSADASSLLRERNVSLELELEAMRGQHTADAEAARSAALFRDAEVVQSREKARELAAALYVEQDRLESANRERAVERGEAAERERVANAALEQERARVAVLELYDASGIAEPQYAPAPRQGMWVPIAALLVGTLAGAMGYAAVAPQAVAPAATAAIQQPKPAVRPVETPPVVAPIAAATPVDPADPATSVAAAVPSPATGIVPAPGRITSTPVAGAGSGVAVPGSTSGTSTSGASSSGSPAPKAAASTTPTRIAPGSPASSTASGASSTKVPVSGAATPATPGVSGSGTSSSTAPAPASGGSSKKLVDQGWAAVETGANDKARELFESAYAGGGGSAALYGRGYANEKLGNSQQAEDDYCKALGATASTDLKREIEGSLRRMGRACPWL